MATEPGAEIAHDPTQPWLAIGKLAALAGLPVDTLRTWERRYGVPKAERLPSGHRRYRLEQVEHLRLCREATATGHRASDVLRLDLHALMALLGLQALERPDVSMATSVPPSGAMSATFRLPSDVGLAQPADTEWIDATVAGWLALARALDTDALGTAMLSAWQRHGALTFADALAGPWLAALGQAWAQGSLSVGQEHVASERLRDVCASQWRPLSAANTGAAVVLCNLAGEHHQLGLHLVAAALAIAGARVVFCGGDTPLDDLIATAIQTRACAVAVSVSAHSDAQATLTSLRRLCTALPPSCAVVVGGAGAPRGFGMEGIEYPSSFAELAAWYSRAHGGGGSGTHARS